jgi:hypothetical protein
MTVVSEDDFYKLDMARTRGSEPGWGWGGLSP